MRAVAYWAQKSSATPDEWEDGAGYSLRNRRAAVADGASSSFEAQRWARILVQTFLDAPPATLDVEAFEHWATAAAGAMPEAHPAGNGGADGDGTPWYVGEAAARGGFATFCGVQLFPRGDRWEWRGQAVGDSCLLHVRDDRLIDAFPLDQPDEFDAAPDLVTTIVYGGDHGSRNLRVRTGEALAGDTLLLATDALAAWSLRRERVGSPAWSMLTTIDHRGFADAVTTLRSAGELADDDVTLLRWELSAP